MFTKPRPAALQEERLGGHALRGALRELGEHGVLGRLEHAVEPAQDGERQDDAAVLVGLVVAAEQVGDGPEEGGEVRVSHQCGGEIGPG